MYKHPEPQQHTWPGHPQHSCNFFVALLVALHLLASVWASNLLECQLKHPNHQLSSHRQLSSTMEGSAGKRCLSVAHIATPIASRTTGIWVHYPQFHAQRTIFNAIYWLLEIQSHRLFSNSLLWHKSSDSITPCTLRNSFQSSRVIQGFGNSLNQPLHRLIGFEISAPPRCTSHTS